MVWKTARELNITTFIDSTKYAVEDDHLSLNIGGLPAIDLIDFDYPYWHTEMDTPDKCSAESLANVGRVLAEIAYNSAIWPNKP
jgi:glutaminyl-peptide cyclotransferase